jgi:hypothetical protein
MHDGQKPMQDWALVGGGNSVKPLKLHISQRRVIAKGSVLSERPRRLNLAYHSFKEGELAPMRK